MNFFKISRRNFSISTKNFLKKEFNLTKKEIKDLNNELKKSYVRPGWDKAVGAWLLASAGITLGMILLGGYVRLNKAGLSMVRWDLTRLSSPKTQAEWEKEFKDYQEHPQYTNQFPDLSLEGFKWIYLLEHWHRQLGKFLGIFFIVPALLFSTTRVFNRKMNIWALSIASIIGIQGCIGYWMVKSGLKENLGNDYKQKQVSVSHYRLAVHFTFGITTYYLLLKNALFLLQKPQVLKTNFEFLASNAIIKKNLMLSVHLVLITAVFGSLLAGQDGGKISNTWPKMGDIWIPGLEHYQKELSVLKNNFENTFLVHFNHRMLGTITLTTILYQTYKVLGLGNIYSGALRGFIGLTFLSMLQFYLGVLNVVMSVPPHLAHLHQFTGVMTVTAGIIALSLSRKVRPNELQSLFKTLIQKDSQKFTQYMNNFKNLHPQTYEKFLKSEYEILVKKN